MDTSFNYMLLGRLLEDCKYYLGYGNKNDKYLWAGNPKDQITKMKELWYGFIEKPLWTSLEEIEDFERQMIQA